MRLTWEEFTDGLELLSAVYGDDHAVFRNSHITNIWFEFFTKYSNDRFLQMIKHYIATCHWFPRVPNDIRKVWEDSGNERPPGENWQLLQSDVIAAFPSREMQQQARELQEAQSLTLEQMAENRRRLSLLCDIAKNLRAINLEDRESQIKNLASLSIHELEAIAKTCQKAKQVAVKVNDYGWIETSSNAQFEDMQKYFHSGSERYRQVAIDWASSSDNGCELVVVNGQVVDIRRIK